MAFPSPATGPIPRHDRRPARSDPAYRNPAAALRAAHGSYAEMLRQAAGLDAAGTHVVASYKDEAPPRAGAYRAALITGSPAMVTDRRALERGGRRLAGSAAGAGLPMFGHLLRAPVCWPTRWAAWWATTRPARTGTLPVELLPAAATDPLLAGLPAAFDPR
ncbi:class-I glutamine amidotransferase) [Bordetella pertussis]|nr:class-I glutamine amidotransferase) [Bordetella pertussis]